MKALNCSRLFICLFAFVLAAAPSFATTKHKKKTPGKSHAAPVKRAGAWKAHGQHEIEGDRAREIQEALIRENYLSGSATGVWDGQTKAAMAKYQADHGWQSKRIPDARALIKLGLGPNHEANPSTEVAGNTVSKGLVTSAAGAGTSAQQTQR